MRRANEPALIGSSCILAAEVLVRAPIHFQIGPEYQECYVAF
jgi:hypothetical protein